MATHKQGTDAIRAELIRLLEAEECEIAQRAEREGRLIMRAHVTFPTQWSVFEFVLKQLREGTPLHAVQ
jgi:hypothetical protein